MKIETLRHFVLLAQAGSFYRASKLSGLSVQGYSKALASLEKELGAELAVRDRTGIRLTEAGEILLEFSLATINGMNRTVELITSLNAGSAGEAKSGLRMRITHGCLQKIALIDSFRDILKRVDIREEPFSDIVTRLHYADGDEIFLVDMFADPTLNELETRGICYEPICRSLVGIAVRTDSPIAKLAQVSRSDIASLDLAHYPHREWNYLIDKVFSSEPLDNLRFEGTSIRMLFDYVHEEPTHALITDSSGFHSLQKNPRYDLQGLAFVPIADSSAELSFGFLSSRKHPPSLKAQVVMDFLRSYYRAEASAEAASRFRTEGNF